VGARVAVGPGEQAADLGLAGDGPGAQADVLDPVAAVAGDLQQLAPVVAGERAGPLADPLLQGGRRPRGLERGAPVERVRPGGVGVGHERLEAGQRPERRAPAPGLDQRHRQDERAARGADQEPVGLDRALVVGVERDGRHLGVHGDHPAVGDRRRRRLVAADHRGPVDGGAPRVAAQAARGRDGQRLAVEVALGDHRGVVPVAGHRRGRGLLGPVGDRGHAAHRPGHGGEGDAGEDEPEPAGEAPVVGELPGDRGAFERHGARLPPFAAGAFRRSRRECCRS
jgi:hypothetical protein